jgi:hypothetical protein
VHLAIFGIWIAANVWGLPGIPRFDPSLAIVATVAPLKAIFLSTFPDREPAQCADASRITNSMNSSKMLHKLEHADT